MTREELFAELRRAIYKKEDLNRTDFSDTYETKDQEKEELLRYYQEILEDMIENGMEEEEAYQYLLTEVKNYYQSDKEAVGKEITGYDPGKTESFILKDEKEEYDLQNTAFPEAGSSSFREAEGFTALDITVSSEDVILRPSSDNVLSIDYEDSAYARLETRLQNGVLYIRIVKERRSLLSFFGMAGDDELKISLPVEKYQSLVFRSSSGSFEDHVGASYETLNIRTTSGDVTLDQGVYADNVIVSTTSGDVYFRKACEADFVQVKTTSGEMYLTGKTQVKEFTFGTQSGEFESEKELNAENISITTVSGDVSMRKASCLDAKLRTVSGDVEIKQMEADDHIQLNAISGDLELKEVKTKRIDAQTVSGEVVIRAVDPMVIFANTVSGDTDIPKNPEGEGEIHVKTTSGDIDIRFLKFTHRGLQL